MIYSFSFFILVLYGRSWISSVGGIFVSMLFPMHYPRIDCMRQCASAVSTMRLSMVWREARITMFQLSQNAAERDKVIGVTISLHFSNMGCIDCIAAPCLCCQKPHRAYFKRAVRTQFKVSSKSGNKQLRSRKLLKRVRKLSPLCVYSGPMECTTPCITFFSSKARISDDDAQSAHCILHYLSCQYLVLPL